MRNLFARLVLPAVLVFAAFGCSDDRDGGGTPPAPIPPPLSIKTISPVSGGIAGGTTVNITGTRFQDTAGNVDSVTFGGAAGTSLTVVDGNTLTVVTPAGSVGAVTVVVSNSSTTAQATEANGFTYLNGPAPAPGIAGIAPSAGGVGGGTLVTITGSAFQTGATVTIGGAAATTVTVLSGGRITCFTPSGTAGAVSVLVTNPDTQNATLLAGYVYLPTSGTNPAPTVGTVSPNSGTIIGGTTVTITGGNFISFGTSKPTVLFGTNASPSVTVIHAGRLVVVSPAGSGAGAVNVIVQNPDGQSGTLASGYTYVIPAPIISSITPNNGPATVPISVTIVGQNFFAGVTVRFGATLATITSAVFLQITVTPPAGTGTVTVTVTNTDAQFATTSYTYNPAPTVSGISPISGPTAGGTAGTVTGTNFVTGATVRVGTNTATSVVVVSATQITCVTPAGAAGVANVTVTNPDTQAGSAASAFTFVPPPAPTAVNVNFGPTAGGTPVTITGTGFQTTGTTTVSFGGSALAAVNVVNATTITGTTSAHAQGAVTVTVTNPDLQTGNVASAFTYTDTPTVTSVNPIQGFSSGGAAATITGTNFLAGATVAFGGTAATSVVVVNSTTITCVTPVHTIGLVAVAVTNNPGGTGTLGGAFRYIFGPNDQTMAYTWDTSAGIDSKRRWLIDFSQLAFTTDLVNAGLQTGTPADSANAYARDYARAYLLQTLNITLGRNADGTKNSGTSVNITFVGITPGSGTPGGSGAGDYSRICVGGCAQNASCNGNSGCSGATVGTASFDAGTPCGDNAENNCDGAPYGGAGCRGIFSRDILNLLGTTLSPSLTQSDVQYFDGTVTSGVAYDRIHNFMKRWMRRTAFVASHEIGHSLGLCGSALTGPCGVATGQCSATNSHNACCSTNIMIDVVSFSDTSGNPIASTAKAFSGQGVSAASSCWTSNSSWAMLGSYVGTSP